VAARWRSAVSMSGTPSITLAARTSIAAMMTVAPKALARDP
jgi:hypothetical protein